jgi:hypothetical protein
MDRYARAVELPEPAYAAKLRNIDNDLKDVSGWQTGMLRTFGVMATRFLTSETRCKMMLVAFDVAAYRQAHGKYPDALAKLPNADQLPVDTFSGTPFNYRLTEDGFMLWSVGPNGVDDGGKDYQNADIVLRVPPEK